jgi:hypothetical protein
MSVQIGVVNIPKGDGKMGSGTGLRGYWGKPS